MYYDRLTDLGIKLTRHSGSEKTFCPKCHDGRKNKRDKSLSVNITTGDYHCHSAGCGWMGNVRSFAKKESHKNFDKPDQNMIKNAVLNDKMIKYIEGRGISKKTIDKLMIFAKQEMMPQTGKKENCICFPYMRDGQLVNVKFRTGAKDFRMVSGAELILYNMNNIGDRKHMIITEGEFDAASVVECGYNANIEANDDGEVLNEQFSKWSVTSVPNGASKGSMQMEYLDNSSDYLLDIQEFIIATDGDEAGNALKDELVRRLGVERCRLITYPIEEVVPLPNGLKRRCKDLNEVLMHLGKQTVIRVIEAAEFIPVDGIFYIEDIFPAMLENFRAGVPLAPTTRFGCIDKLFRWKKGDLNLVVGYGNHGKTTFLIQLMLIKSIWDGWKWGIFSPENFPANDFYDDMIEMYAGKWLQDMSENEYSESAKFINEHFFYVYPEEKHDVLSIHEKFRYLVMKKGIDGILLDPFNQLDHTQKAYQREDQYLSETFKDMKRFALLNNIAYNIITHPIKPAVQSDKSLPVVDVFDIAGGAMWNNKMDNILSYYRPNWHIDKTDKSVQIYCQKVKRKRTGGELGMVELSLIWSKKRFADAITGDIPCDPYAAKQGKAQPLFALPPLEPRMPYKDNDSDDIGF